MQIQISWLLKKPTDLELHCLQMQDLSGLSRTRVKVESSNSEFWRIVTNNDVWQKSSSLDPDETARYEPPHLDLHFLHRYIFWTAGMQGFNILKYEIFIL